MVTVLFHSMNRKLARLFIMTKTEYLTGDQIKAAIRGKLV
jgi:hypothetical protein